MAKEQESKAAREQKLRERSQEYLIALQRVDGSGAKAFYHPEFQTPADDGIPESARQSITQIQIVDTQFWEDARAALVRYLAVYMHRGEVQRIEIPVTWLLVSSQWCVTPLESELVRALAKNWRGTPNGSEESWVKEQAQASLSRASRVGRMWRRVEASLKELTSKASDALSRKEVGLAESYQLLGKEGLDRLGRLNSEIELCQRVQKQLGDYLLRLKSEERTDRPDIGFQGDDSGLFSEVIGVPCGTCKGEGVISTEGLLCRSSATARTRIDGKKYGDYQQRVERVVKQLQQVNRVMQDKADEATAKKTLDMVKDGDEIFKQYGPDADFGRLLSLQLLRWAILSWNDSWSLQFEMTDTKGYLATQKFAKCYGSGEGHRCLKKAYDDRLAWCMANTDGRWQKWQLEKIASGGALQLGEQTQVDLLKNCAARAASCLRVLGNENAESLAGACNRCGAEGRVGCTSCVLKADRSSGYSKGECFICDGRGCERCKRQGVCIDCGGTAYMRCRRCGGATKLVANCTSCGSKGKIEFRIP